MKKKEAKLEADRLNSERWQEWSADLADEMIFKFERENEEPAEDGTKRRRLSRSIKKSMVVVSRGRKFAGSASLMTIHMQNLVSFGSLYLDTSPYHLPLGY